MAVNLSFIGGAGWQFFDNNGDPLSGGKLFTYAAGTTTPLTTYTSRDGLTPNANPIILDSAGRTPAQIWSTEGLLYKYVIMDANNVSIRTWDNIGGSVVASNLAQDLANTTNNAAGDALVGFRQSDSTGFLTGAVARTVSAKLEELVNVKDFGAVGDGVTDDTAAIYAATQAAANGLIFEGTFRLSSAAPYTNAFSGAPNAYIPIINKTRFKIDASRARFIVDYDFVTNNTSAALFAVIGSSDVYIDAINCYATSQSTSQYIKGVEPLVVTDNGTTGSKNIYVSSIDCTDVAGCFRAYLSGGDNEYRANGFSSTQRSSGIYIANARMVNGADLIKAGYGIQVQLSGDNLCVENARFINVHRSLIAYGVQNVKANIWDTDFSAATIALGGYANIDNFDVRLKSDGTDTIQATAANVAQLAVHDFGTSGGASLDILAGRTAYIRNVKIDFNVSVSSRSALCYVGKEGNASANSPILFQNIILSGYAAGIATGVRLAQAYISPTVQWSNTVFDNIIVRDMSITQSSYATMRTGFNNALVFENYVGNSIFCDYDGVINEYPVIYRNCTLTSITSDNHRNLYAILENCHLNQDNQSAVKIQPFNKQLINTRIGNSTPINKRQHDVYSDINSAGLTSSLSAPEEPKTYLVGGGFLDSGVADAPLTLDLTAEPAVTKPTSTTSRQIDHFSFSDTTNYVVANTKTFYLYVRNENATITAVYTGYLTLQGPARTNFNSCTIKLAGVSVTNITGASYQVGDLTVSAPDADTIRFSMSRNSRLINVVLYDS